MWGKAALPLFAIRCSPELESSQPPASSYQPEEELHVPSRHKLHEPPTSGEKRMANAETRLFPRFCLQVSRAQDFTGKVFCHPNGIKILRGTRGRGVPSSGQLRPGGSPRIHAGESRRLYETRFSAGAEARNRSEAPFPSDKSEGFHPKPPAGSWRLFPTPDT